MVSFICDACGSTVKKNQVEKHYATQCRNCSVLSCVDCGVDFPGDAYISHISCISEAEKYQGHLYQPKDKANKGEAKQKQWIKNLQTAGNNVTDPRLKSLLEKLTEYSNIPRKKNKFENFCKNSVKVYDEKTLTALWDAFNATHSQSKAQSHCTSSAEKNADAKDLNDECKNSDDKTDEEAKEKKKKKKKKMDKYDEVVRENATHAFNNIEETKKIKNKNRKRKINKEENSEEYNDKVLKKIKKKKLKASENEIKDELSINQEQAEQEQQKEDSQKVKFDWHKAIKTALKEVDDKELPLKKLRKKVLSAYQEHGTDNRATNLNECRAMFEKKLKTYSKAKVKKEMVTLVK